MKHTCHADGCNKVIPPKLLMCPKHWRMVRSDVQNMVWKHYRPGQEVDKKPSTAYLAAHHLAVACVADKEGRIEAFQNHAKLAEQYVEQLENEVST